MAHRIGYRRLHHWLHFAADQLILGLTGEFRIRHFHRQHGGHAFAHILAHQRQAFLLAHAFGVFRHHARQRLAEPGQMRAAVALRNIVREAQHGFMETVVPGQRELHADAHRCFLGRH